MNFKKAAQWFISDAPALSAEDKILSRRALNYIRLLTKREEHDNIALESLKRYFNEAVTTLGTENYNQVKNKMTRQLQLNGRIPEEFTTKFSSTPVTELLRPEQ